MTSRGRFRLRIPRSCSLAALLLLVAAVAVPLAWYDRPRRQERAVALARHVGGFASHDDEYVVGRAPPPQPHRLDWLREQIGHEYAHDLTVLSLDGAKVSDDDLEALEGLTRLRRLYLNGTPVTDAGLAHLSKLTDLERLELRETAITDAGLVHLARLTKLRKLYLSNTRIHDAGLVHLTGLKNLEEIHLYETQVTAAGLNALRRALPQARIVVGTMKLDPPDGMGSLQYQDPPAFL
jgi:hypothetical protein